MAHRMMYGQHPLHHDTPHHHQQRQPSVDGATLHKAHIPWRHEIESHDGWYVPERKLVVKPEVPVDGDVAYEVDNAAREATRPKIVGQIERCSNDKPCGHYAQQATAVEAAHVGCLHPREPQPYSTQKQEYVDTHIATTPQSVERVATVESNVEEYDEEHCGSHLLSTKS